MSGERSQCGLRESLAHHAELLQQINQGLLHETQQRYDQLQAKYNLPRRTLGRADTD